MKLISLNTWGGKLYKPLIEFIKKYSEDTDIFCFQEVFKTLSNTKVFEGRRINLYGEISKALKNYQGYFAPFINNYIIVNRSKITHTNFSLSQGLCIFVRKDLKVESSGSFFVYGNINSFNPRDLNSIPRNAQYINFKKRDKKFTICNLHGIWLKEGKLDSPSRIEQSRQIKQFLNKQKGKKILCGDFNLDISTESVKLLEKDMRNLIKQYKIPTTRNKHFPGDEKFADYIFISNGIEIESFEVPNVDISDHLPLILEFS